MPTHRRSLPRAAAATAAGLAGATLACRLWHPDLTPFWTEVRAGLALLALATGAFAALLTLAATARVLARARHREDER